LGQEKPWCFIFSAKLRYEEDFFERISRILYFFVMFWRSIRNVVIVKNKTPRLFLTQQPIEAIYAGQPHTTELISQLG
jgi:hypothetical protein